MEETGFTGIDTSTAESGVTLEEAKRHFRVDHSEDDYLIASLCLACTQMAEHELQRGIIIRARRRRLCNGTLRAFRRVFGSGSDPGRSFLRASRGRPG